MLICDLYCSLHICEFLYLLKISYREFLKNLSCHNHKERGLFYKTSILLSTSLKRSHSFYELRRKAFSILPSKYSWYVVTFETAVCLRGVVNKNRANNSFVYTNSASLEFKVLGNVSVGMLLFKKVSKIYKIS